MTTITLSLFVLSIIYAAIQVAFAVRKHRMHKKEQLLKSSGTLPYGSGLCHGMVS